MGELLALDGGKETGSGGTASDASRLTGTARAWTPLGRPAAWSMLASNESRRIVGTCIFPGLEMLR